MAVGWETKIGSGTNFVDRGCTSSADVSIPTFAGGVSGPLIARLRLFAQQECTGIGYGSVLCCSFRRLLWSITSVRAGPARDGWVATEDVGKD